MTIKGLLSLWLLAPALSFAANTDTYEFLRHGFDMKAYATCQKELAKCPATTALPNSACLKTVADETTACQQLSKLTDAVQGGLGLVTVEAAPEKFAIATVSFPADGGEEYYVLSRNGAIVKTTIDPRTVDAKLKKRYAAEDFMVQANGKLDRQTWPNGSQTFIAPLKITKGCRACEVVGMAKVSFLFSHAGQLVKTKVVSFQ